MSKQADDFLVLTEALRKSLAGEEIGGKLSDAAEKVVLAGRLPEFGRAAMTLLLQHRLAHLLVRRTVILAGVIRPPFH